MEHFYRNRRKSLLTCSRKSTKPQRNVIIRFKGFNFENSKTRDNCHYTGLYWEAAHSDFKLKYPIPEFITITFHNLSGYDAHLFIKELAKSLQGWCYSHFRKSGEVH